MRSLILLALIYSTTVSAQQPTVTHASITQASGRSLAAEIEDRRQGKAPVWLGYRIPTENYQSHSSEGSTVYLDGDHSWSGGDHESAKYDHALVLMHLTDHAVSKIRVEDEKRVLDTNGTAFVWLESVTPEESVAVLKDVATHENDSLRESALFALSIHRSSSTLPTLIELASSGHDEALREKAAFWLSTQSSKNGPEALEAIRRFSASDPDTHFREKLTFDLTLIKQPGALDELIRMAHEDSAPNVRRQAQFWMATVGGKRVSDDLQRSVVDDPEQEVRKSAVFALSRLPEGEATTQLIHTAQQSKDPEVRKQAVFWLGQSSDPRALAYLTTLLR